MGILTDFAPITQVQLGEDVADMVLDGVFADDQMAGDIAVGCALRELADQFNFARGQLDCAPVVQCGSAVVVFENSSRMRRAMAGEMPASPRATARRRFNNSVARVFLNR